jgi:hypothetical protein
MALTPYLAKLGEFIANYIAKYEEIEIVEEVKILSKTHIIFFSINLF